MTKRKNRAKKISGTFTLPAGLEYYGYAVTCHVIGAELCPPDDDIGAYEPYWDWDDSQLFYLDGNVEIDCENDWFKTNACDIICEISKWCADEARYNGVDATGDEQ